MDIAVIISLISLAGVVTQSYLSYRSKEKESKSTTKKTDAEAISIEVRTAKELIAELRTTVDEHKKKINELMKEIDKLKKQEGYEKIEKLRLEEKISELMSENEALRKQVKNNQLDYNLQIKKLKEQISKLKEALNKYTDEHP